MKNFILTHNGRVHDVDMMKNKIILMMGFIIVVKAVEKKKRY